MDQHRRRRESPDRNPALDALRGLIVVLMALDHANYFVAQRHSTGEHWGGPFPEYDGTLAFLTRLVTHPVAPGFFFLMGIGMVLFAASRRARGWSEGAITRHFLTRGLVLIVLQFTVVNLAWRTGPRPFPNIYLGVLVALGGGMIIGSLFLRLQPGPLIAMAAVLLVGSEMLHPDPSQWGLDAPLGLVFAYSGGDAGFRSNYPILPWLELVFLGMAFGWWIRKDERKAFAGAIVLGTMFLAAFLVLRTADGFGNIRPREGDGWIGYLNVVKYPPSMTFTLLTMGGNLIVLGLLSRARGGILRLLAPLVTLGRVPLFFYVTHLFLFSGLGAWLAPGGTSFPVLYPYWLGGVAVLYPLCRWYDVLKRSRSPESPLRLF